jgi:hypothetical protein
MVERKKVAIVIGRYYLTLPVVTGFYHLFDWDITVLDLDIDATHVAKDHFYAAVPPVKVLHLPGDNKTLAHFRETKYDFVIATNITFRSVNWARSQGYIQRLYILFGAFLKPGVVKPSAQAVASPRSRTARIMQAVFKPGLYARLKGYLKRYLQPAPLIPENRKDAYDLIFCWNKTESFYYEGPRQKLTAHPYHLYLARQAQAAPFHGRILMAHNGDPDYYTEGYNELIQAVITRFGDAHEVIIKAHPLGRNFPAFTGRYQVIRDVIQEDAAAGFDIFICEDSYMAVEMFFRGKHVINFGLVDAGTSNLDFTHLWSDHADNILSEIQRVILNWDAVQAAHVQALHSFYNNYNPPEEFGALRPMSAAQ